MENKYLNITINSLKKISENNQYYSMTNNIDYFTKNNDINNTKK
tara:strand:+ start:1157 stop:1288 length:132 start_codon:yes stop_codon:yes gene_type:complete